MTTQPKPQANSAYDALVKELESIEKNAHDALIEACEAYEDFISLWQDALLRNMTKTMLDDQLALPRKFLKLAKGEEQ